MTIEELNSRFGIPRQLAFEEGPGGLVFARIDNGLGSAALCLQGAHLTRFQPRDQTVPLVWLSDHASFAPGRSIRGGMPVCWPWFGSHATESDFPAHGFARTVSWEVTQTMAVASGETAIVLALSGNDQTHAQWPHPSRLELELVVGTSLRAGLTTTNLGRTEFVVGEALHTYFQIGDIAEIEVRGLEGCEYVDKVGGVHRRSQSGSVTFAGEVDRVYVNREDRCVIEDRRLRRRIVIAKTGSRSTVVWNPWAAKAERMGDLGPEGWRRMVCVESGNALDNVVVVPAGESHRLSVEYSAQAL
jgi:D-hexose-6-phosphate mutarotase